MARDYTTQFKEQAMRLVSEQGYEPTRAARELGIPFNTLFQWLKKAGWTKPRVTPPKLPDARLPEEPEALKVRIRELQERVKRLEMEKEILKKATAFFASQST